MTILTVTLTGIKCGLLLSIMITTHCSHQFYHVEVLNDDHRNKIVDTITMLNILLDVEKPWTFVVDDPMVRSE